MASQVVAGVRDYVQQTGQSDLSPESIALAQPGPAEHRPVHAREGSGEQKTSLPRISTPPSSDEKQFPTKEAFQQYMDSSGIKMKALQERIAAQLSQQMVLEANTPQAEVTDEEARAFYDQAKEVYFRHPAGYNVLYARFSEEGKAEEARKALAGGGKWDDVIKGGEGAVLDFTPSGEPAFVAEREFTEGDLKGIADTPLGKVSKALTLGEGNVVIVIKEKKLEEKIVPFEETSADAREMVAYQKRRAGQAEYLQGLIAEAGIQVLAPEFFEVPAPAGDEGEGTTEEGAPSRAERRTSGE